MEKRVSERDEFVGMVQEMEFLAGLLNQIPYLKDKKVQQGRKEVENVVNFFKTNPFKAVSLFNRLIKKDPVLLWIARLDWKGGTFSIFPSQKVSTDVGLGLSSIWKILMWGELHGWERFKRCPVCRRWFVDDTRNKKKARCSKDCTWQYWSWSKRKEANHDLSQHKKNPT